MRLILVLWILAVGPALAATPPLMISPAHDERVDVSSHTLNFTWKGEAEREYLLDVYYKRARKPSRTFKVKGSSYQVRFKKLPPVFYWRVRPEDNLSASSTRVNRVHLYEAASFFINAFAGYSSSNIILSSKDFNRAADVSGNLMEISWKSMRTTDLPF